MKAARNAIKHRVRFPEAASVFFDEHAVFEPDPDHSEEEERYLVLGYSIRFHMLLVVHVIRGERIAHEQQPQRKGDTMTKAEEEFEMRDEYDFSNGIKNPFVQSFQELNLVSLDPDVKAAFPDSASVNTALRLLIKAAKNIQDLPKAS